jgi:hypothetical protein
MLSKTSSSSEVNGIYDSEYKNLLKSLYDSSFVLSSPSASLNIPK